MNKQLKELLDSVEFYKNKDGKEYTPRSMYVSMYDQLIKDSTAYFAELLDTIDEDAMQDEKKIFDDAGGGHHGAMAILESNIDMLQYSTLEYKTKKSA